MSPSSSVLSTIMEIAPVFALAYSQVFSILPTLAAKPRVVVFVLAFNAKAII